MDLSLFMDVGKPLSEEPTPELCDSLIGEIDERKSRLHFIEQEIVDGLRKKPYDEWCSGCYRLLVALHKKATKGEELF